MAYVIVAIPTHNNEEYLGTVLLKARSNFSHILVVDDGSEDDTARIAKAAGVDLVRHPLTLGMGAVYRSVLREALEKKPEVLVVLNGNGYCNPDNISYVLDELLKSEAEIVECEETGFAAYSGSILPSLIVRDDRIQVDESRLGREPTIRILMNNKEAASDDRGMVKSGG
ncbi:MAG: glycosyltransferase [Thermoplasmata archaeon]|nr:glycosyltransferase [Thermoplasmata archaeon]